MQWRGSLRLERRCLDLVDQPQVLSIDRGDRLSVTGAKLESLKRTELRHDSFEGVVARGLAGRRCSHG